MDVENLNQYIDTWGLFDLGKVGHCVAQSDGYLVVRQESEEFHVTPEKYTVIPTPKFDFGDMVYEPGRLKNMGKICYIAWHSKREQHMFFIRIGNKVKSKRFFAEDLERIE